MAKFSALLYGTLCYLFFGIVFLYAIAFVSNVIVPRTIDNGPPAPIWLAVAIDLVLMTIFALQHSVMARQGFKRWWTKFVAPAVERSTYVLAASLALALLVWEWRPIPQPVWQITDPVWSNTVLALSLIGWGMVVFSTFLLNHFELFGLAQVARNFRGREAAPPRMHTPSLYRFVRHPIYLGFILAFWAAPIMSVGHLMFAAVTTAYIYVGILLEERDLISFFGDEYRRYRARVPMLIPWRRPL
ncbi:MAG TPA: isoprenylcysteine carboxylmethyltransferase family protein [Rhizomicrobium sp.]|jgi:protein-S-isoprenylcysteine O-methyltransferase Ste14|nr:isoprenylcysteine carboxylmethyltransferase family protein [Rhizomicrobium sp.]